MSRSSRFTWRDDDIVLEAEDAAKVFDPDQERDESGRWTSGGGGGSTSSGEPPSRAWREPPPPRGRPGGKAGGFSSTGKTNTAIGDLGEAVVRQMGFESLLEPGVRQGPLDASCCGGWGFEVKTYTTDSTEYKVRMKASEVESKLRYAKEKGLKPAVAMVVMDARSGRAQVYWREGIGNYRLSEASGWKYMGEARVR